MNYLPDIFEPFTPVMAVLVFAWYLAFSLALHRCTRYLMQSRAEARWPKAVDKTATALRTSVADAPTDRLLTRLCTAVQSDAGTAALSRFHNDVVQPLRRPDRWNDRGLKALFQIAPLLGLIGTVAGISAAFSDLAAAGELVTLKDLAGPVCLALRTTMHGGACAAFCIAVREMSPAPELHQQADQNIESAWDTFGAIFDELKTRKRRISSPTGKAADGDSGLQKEGAVI